MCLQQLSKNTMLVKLQLDFFVTEIGQDNSSTSGTKINYIQNELPSYQILTKPSH